MPLSASQKTKRGHSWSLEVFGLFGEGSAMPTHPSSLREENIGQRVKSRRQALGLSEEAFAGALGVTREQLQKYETGQSCIEAARLQHVAEILKVPVLFLFGGTFSARPSRAGGCEIIDFAARSSDSAKPDPGTPRVDCGKVKSG
jgi:transcriptional regulator with XRE-family HTH domain